MSSEEVKMLSAKLDLLSISVKELTDALIGDINDSEKPSVYMRIDRLEQKEKTRGVLTWMVLGCVVSLVLERLAEVL